MANIKETYGKLLNIVRTEKLHRFTNEKQTLMLHEKGERYERAFFSRKDGVEVANFNSTEGVLYLATRYMNRKEYQPAINEAKRLTKATVFSEFINV